MKVLGVVLAILVLTVTLIPCDDFHSENQQGTPVVSTEHSSNQNADLCSPLCFCACCGLSVSECIQPSISSLSVVQYMSYFDTYRNNYVTNYCSSCFHPPAYC